MLALTVLLTIAGVVLLAAAAGIPLYQLWLRVHASRPGTRSNADAPGAHSTLE